MSKMSKITIIAIFFTVLSLVVSCHNTGPETSGPPVISSFTLPNGNTTETGTVEVSLEDDGTATGWMIKTESTVPTAESSGWLTGRPVDFTLPVVGTYELYAWAKNSSGQVSETAGPLAVEYVDGPTPGEFIITEFMVSPQAVSGPEGQWFEIFNSTDRAINLKGSRFGNAGAESFTISDSLTVPPSSYLVFARSDAGSALLPNVDYVYDNFTLSADDEILLTSPSGVEIDKITYEAASVEAGKSTQLFSLYYDSAINDNPDAWSVSTRVISAANSDLGTPGSENDTVNDRVFFSEYIEGSSQNKAVEIYNGFLIPVELSDMEIEIYSNGSTSVSNSVQLDAGTLAPGEVWVIGDPDCSFAGLLDQTSNKINFNGNDAVALVYDGTRVDVIGQIGFDPGTQWGVEPCTTLDHTLRRNCSVIKGDGDGSDVFDPADEWTGFPVDTLDGLGERGCP